VHESCSRSAPGKDKQSGGSSASWATSSTRWGGTSGWESAGTPATFFNAGYDIASAAGLEQTLEEMDREVGLDRLAAVHANDSKNPLGSNLDRHENIGQGHLGEDSFARLLEHPALAEAPFLLEVPGFDGQGPDLANIAILRRLAGRPLEETVVTP
jgi:hypothetical protein